MNARSLNDPLVRCVDEFGKVVIRNDLARDGFTGSDNGATHASS